MRGFFIEGGVFFSDFVYCFVVIESRFLVVVFGVVWWSIEVNNGDFRGWRSG